MSFEGHLIDITKLLDAGHRGVQADWHGVKQLLDHGIVAPSTVYLAAIVLTLPAYASSSSPSSIRRRSNSS